VRSKCYLIVRYVINVITISQETKEVLDSKYSKVLWISVVIIKQLAFDQTLYREKSKFVLARDYETQKGVNGK
jgi:hypothetical protein